MNWLFNPVFITFSQIFIMMVLVVAAYPKLTNRDEFHGVVMNYRILPKGLALPFATILPYLEFACAIGLIFSGTAAVAGGLACALFLSFALAMGVNVARGRTHIDCGCLRGPNRGNGIGWFQVGRALGLGALSGWLSLALPALERVSTGELLIGTAAAVMAATLYLGAELIAALPKIDTRNT